MPVTTRQLSKIAQVAEQTVRNYSREYADLLSPAARGDIGPRLFSDEDVQVFCSIATLRKSGVPPAEVMARLQRGDVYIDATPNTPQAPPSPQNEPQAYLLSHNALQHQIDALRQAQGRALWSHGVAFYLGMVTMGVLFYVVWLLVNG